MSVGLFDADLYQHGAMPFNIDLMKLSTYYKKQRQIVSMSQFYHPDKYTHYIVRKDINDGNFRDLDFTKQNVSYGGLAFSNGIYYPLDESIEKLPPDPEIYSKMELYFGRGLDKSLFQICNNSMHIRLAPDGKNISENCFSWANQPTSFYNIFVHDLGFEKFSGVRQLIEDTFPSKNIYVQNKFPITTKSDEEFLDWYNWSKLGQINTFKQIGLLDDSCIEVIGESVKKRAGRIEYLVDIPNEATPNLVDETLSTLLRQSAYLRSKRRKISLKSAENYFFDGKTKRFLELVDIYEKNYPESADNNTLFDFIKYLKWREKKGKTSFGFTVVELRKIMTHLKENYPQTFELCYILDEPIMKGGKLING